MLPYPLYPNIQKNKRINKIQSIPLVFKFVKELCVLYCQNVKMFHNFRNFFDYVIKVSIAGYGIKEYMLYLSCKSADKHLSA